jgi:hypothetical protein
MKRNKPLPSGGEAKAKAFLKQVNVKKEKRNLTKAYMALKGSERSNAKRSGK